jgi:hypothetical protein
MQRQVTRVVVAATTMVVAVGVIAVPSSMASRNAGPRTSPLVGTVQRLHLDAFGAPAQVANEADSDEVAVLHTAQGSVRLDSNSVAGVPDGTTVRANIVSDDATTLIDKSLTGAAAVNADAGADVSSTEVLAAQPSTALANGSTASAATAVTAASSVPTQHEVTIVLATWPGLSRDSMTSAALASLVDGSISSYWANVTHGQISFHTAARYGWISTSTPACSNGDAGTNSFTFWNQVKAKVGFVEAPGRHLVVYFPRTSACGGSAGLATIGSGIDSGGLSWTNGYANRGVMGHEIGHNLSLGHSDELRCTSAGRTLVDWSVGSCTKRGYWDLTDIMGISWNNQGYLSAAHQEYLGVLPGGASLDVQSSTRVTLAPVASNSGLRAVRFRTGGSTYVVEYRAAVGLDSWLSSAKGWGDPGVYVHRVFDYAAMSSANSARLPERDTYLLDGNPATNDDDLGQMKTTFPVGSWASVAAGHGGIRVVSLGGVATVDIDVDGSQAGGATGAASQSRAVASLTRGQIGLVHGAVVAPARLTWNLVGAKSAVNVNAAVVAMGVRSTATDLAAGYGRWRINRWRVVATNAAGKLVSTAAKAYGTVLGDAPRQGAHYRGRWATTRIGGALGRSEHATKRRGASMTIKVRARGVGVIASKTKIRGRMKVYVNGRYAGTIDLFSARALKRQVVWTRMFSRTSVLTIKLVCLGTRGRGQVGFDGLVLLA